MRQAVTGDLYTLNQTTAFQDPSRLKLACYEPANNELHCSVLCERILRWGYKISPSLSNGYWQILLDGKQGPRCL